MKLFFSLFFTLAVLFFSSSLIHAQETASVSGYISEKATGETLISANIALIDINKGASTNTLGYYTITNITPGTYTIVASYIGFIQFRREITLAPSETLRLDVELVAESFSLEEVVVESESEKEELKNIGSAQVKTELIKSLPAVIEADVFRSIQLLPGVKAASDFSSGLYIRGGSPDQTLILLDRTTVYNPSHFFGFFSTFNPDAIKDVRLFKGGYPAEFGGRLGSVLTIYNKDGNRNEMSGSVTAGLLASRALIEGPIKNGSYMFAIRRSTLEPILNVLSQSVDNIPTKFYFFDINAKLNYDAGRNDKLSLALYTGEDNVVFPFGEGAVFGLNYGNQTLSGNWTHIFNEKLFSNFVFTGSRYFNFPEFELGGTPFERENNIYDFSMKSDLEYLPNEKHLLSTGVWTGVLTLNLRNRFDNRETSSQRIHSRYASVYLQDTWRPTQKWEVIGGVRGNYFSDGQYVRLEPRLSVEHKFSPRFRLQTAYGRYTQFLTLISNEAFSGFDTWLTADDGVNPSYGDQFVIGAKTLPFENLGFDVEVYYRTMNDLFELDPFTPDVAGVLYKDLFRIGEGSAYGAEFFIERQQGRFNGFIGYTLGYTWRKFPGYNVEVRNGAAAARFYPPKYDRRNDINVVGSYRFSKRWKTTASYNYATGQAYTQVLGRYALQRYPFGNTLVQAFTVGKVNASRLPSYQRFDISFSRFGTFFGIGEAEWQFQIINLTSRRNIWFYNFNFDENPVVRDEVPLLPILPAVSYTVKF